MPWLELGWLFRIGTMRTCIKRASTAPALGQVALPWVRQLPSAREDAQGGHSCEPLVFNTLSSWGNECLGLVDGGGGPGGSLCASRSLLEVPFALYLLDHW